jgi:hypothetical protein
VQDTSTASATAPSTNLVVYPTIEFNSIQEMEEAMRRKNDELEHGETDEYNDIKTSHGDQRVFFNIHEKYYDELFDIYERIHQTEGREKDPIIFPFDEYSSTMETVLFKIRKYDTLTLLNEMKYLKNKFTTDYLENDKKLTIELSQMDMLPEVRHNISEAKTRAGIQGTDAISVAKFCELVDNSAPPTTNNYIKIPENLNKLWENLKEEIKGYVREEPRGITEYDSQEIYGGGQRTRTKTRTRKRHTNPNKTHKRALKFYSKRITKRRNKRGQKRYKTR